MQTFAEWLQYYNNLDVEPFIEALGSTFVKTLSVCPALHYSISYGGLKKESCMHQVQKHTNI